MRSPVATVAPPSPLTRLLVASSHGSQGPHNRNTQTPPVPVWPGIGASSSPPPPPLPPAQRSVQGWQGAAGSSSPLPLPRLDAVRPAGRVDGRQLCVAGCRHGVALFHGPQVRRPRPLASHPRPCPRPRPETRPSPARRRARALRELRSASVAPHAAQLRLPEGGPKVPAAERRDGERLWRAVAGHAAAAGRAAAGRAGGHGA